MILPICFLIYKLFDVKLVDYLRFSEEAWLVSPIESQNGEILYTLSTTPVSSRTAGAKKGSSEWTMQGKYYII